MDKGRLEEIRHNVEVALGASPDSLLAMQLVLLQDVPDLLDALEDAQARVEVLEEALKVAMADLNAYAGLETNYHRARQSLEVIANLLTQQQPIEAERQAKSE